jgi:multicomponent Na+:H+ antiporter subunit D
MSQQDTLLMALLGLPLLAAAGVLVFRHWPNLRDGQAIVLGVITALCALQLFATGADGSSLEVFTMASGLRVAFTPEPLGLLFALVAGSLWPIATLYTVGYLRGAQEVNQTRFMFFYAIAIHAAMGIALSGNLLTLFIFYEMLTFSTYPLVTHKGTEDAIKAGRVTLAFWSPARSPFCCSASSRFGFWPAL